MKKIVLLTLIAISGMGFAQASKAPIEDEKLAQLQAVINESKLLPIPAGVGGNGARFGESVSIDGNRALIGSPRGVEHGVAYIFDYDGTTWNETQLFFPDGLDAGNGFGTAVSLQGDRAIITDKFDSVVGAFQAGAVYVYDLNNGNWELTQKLVASDAGNSDKFGSSVSLSGDRVLIGANRNASGVAYVFDYNGSSWQESAILTAIGGSSGDEFGNSVSLDGDKALVGAKNFDDNNNGINTGSAYLFELVGASWTQTKQFLASDGVDNDRFGVDVGVSSSRVLIGADMTDEMGSAAGSVYIYEFDGTVWNETKLLAPDARNADKFGGTVSIENNRMLVGATDGGILPARTGSAYIFDFDTNSSQWIFTQEIAGDDITTGNSFFASSLDLSGDKVIVGNFNDHDNGSQSGAAYVFELDGAGSWQQSQKVVTLGAVDDNFGYSVSLDGLRALVGAPKDIADGIDRGAAYIFNYINGQWSAPIKLLASDTSINFGSAVDLDGNNAIIAANSINQLSNGKIYIYNFDGTTWNEVALFESPSIVSDEFGSDVSILADRAIVGVSNEIEAGIKSGTVYIYEKITGTWQFTGKLIPSDAELFANFGVSVSLTNDRVLVGANAKDDTINNLSNAGAAYVYDYDSINDLWIETKLQAIVPSFNGFFGWDVEIKNDRAIIGAAGSSHSAYVFDYDSVADLWNPTKLQSTASARSGLFGNSVSLDGDSVLVGAYFELSNGISPGSVYQYDFDGINWNEVKKHVPSDAADRDFYGWSVAISGKRALFGSYKDDDRGTDSGSVYTINDVDLLFTDGFEN